LGPPTFIHILKNIKELLTFGCKALVERWMTILMVLTRAKLGHR
jgi:hypothetical protein